MYQETIYLVEATDSTGTVHRFCTGSGYTSLPSDTPPNAFYSPRVDQPGLFRQNMFAKGTTGGASSDGNGVVDLFNTDFALDGLIDLGFDGQLFVVKEGNPGAALFTFADVITATVEQIGFSWNRVTATLRDKAALLATPVQLTYYLGNNALPDGIEGGPELKGKPKPRLVGNPGRNLTPICVNTSKLVYQVNSGPVFAIPAVHDGGNVGQITQGANYATSALLLATDPAANTYTTCLAEGLFRLGSAPIMQITCEAIEGATAADRTVAQIAKRLAVEKVGASAIVEQSIIDTDKAAPYEVGYYTDSNDPTTSVIMDELCQSIGAWWGFDNLGNLWLKQLTAPVASQALLTLTTDEILTIDRTGTADGDKGIPAYRVNMDYSKNWTVQTSGLAGSLPNNALSFAPPDLPRRQSLAMEYLRTKDEDLTVLGTHALAPVLNIKTLLANESDAHAEASRILALRKVRRDRLTLKVKLNALQYPAGGYWDDEAISEMPQSRTYTNSSIFNNYLYVFGGLISGSNSASVIRLDLNNPAGAWDDAGVTDLPVALSGASISVFGGLAYLIGGFFNVILNQVISLNLASPTGAWSSAGISQLPATRWLHSSSIHTNWLYVIGGENTASVIRLDLNNPAGAWDDAGVTDLPVARRLHASVVFNNYLYVFGGLISGSNSASVIRLDLNNPAGAWDDAGVTDLPVARRDCACVIQDNYVYLLGGVVGTTESTSVIRLDLNNPAGAWDDAGVTDLPAERGATSAQVFGGSIYLIGGGFGSNSYANTWRLRTNDNPEDRNQITSLGRTVIVKHPRYGYTAGRPMKIIGTESDYKTRIMTLEVWG